MVTFKRLGLRMKRNSKGPGWVVLDSHNNTIHESAGNKGVAMSEALEKNFVFTKAKGWHKDADV